MYYMARIDNWYPSEQSQDQKIDCSRFIVPTQDDEYGIVIRLKNGRNFVMADHDE